VVTGFVVFVGFAMLVAMILALVMCVVILIGLGS
jgi:hypothetical protein